MKRTDGRTLSHDVSGHIRLTAMRRVREGEKPSSLMKVFGLCRTTIYKWMRLHHKKGDDGLKASKHPGPECRLTPRQKQQVFRWINGKDPRQYGFEFGLWTRKIVATMIQEKFKVSLGLTAVGRLLAEINITPQKPLRRAYERDPEAIQEWKETAYPRLKARAKRFGAKIFFLDEAGVRSDQVLGKTWGVNPDEFVWNYLKNEGVSKKPLKKKESLKSRVTMDLASIKNRPVLVRSFLRLQV